jgi:hypothetical protein
MMSRSTEEKENDVCWNSFVKQNQIKHSRRKTRREDSRSPGRMKRVLGSHWLWAVVIECD